jgi:hypothetical protein
MRAGRKRHPIRLNNQSFEAARHGRSCDRRCTSETFTRAMCRLGNVVAGLFEEMWCERSAYAL